jgi:hypothetical protein
MTQIALDIQNNAPRDPLAPAAATVASSYTQALDTVRVLLHKRIKGVLNTVHRYNLPKRS